MKGSGGIPSSGICLAVFGALPSRSSQPRKKRSQQAAKASQRSRPEVEGIGVAPDAGGKNRSSLDFFSRTATNSSIMSSGPGSSCNNRREQLSQGGGDGGLLLPDPALGVPDRESAVMSSTPGIRKPKGRIQTFRVESRWKAPHWNASRHIWVGSYCLIEEAMRAHDTTLHYTRKTPYYYIYPQGYFDPLPAELEDAPLTEEFVMFVKVMAKKFGMTEFRKLKRNPLSELASAPSRKPCFSSRSNKLCAGRSKRTWANKMEAPSEVKRLSLSSADSSELSSRELADFAAESSPVQVPIDFNASRTFFAMDFSIDGYLEKGFGLSADDDGIGGDREDEDHVLDMQLTTNFVPSAAADAQFLPAATTGVASSIPGDVSRGISSQVSSAADSELTRQVLEVPEFISHHAQLFPEVPTDLNNASSFDMEFSIDAYPEDVGVLPPADVGIGGDREDDEVAEFVTYPSQLFQVPKDFNASSIDDMELFTTDDDLETGGCGNDYTFQLAELDDSTLFSSRLDDTEANLVPSFTINGDAMAMPGPHNPTFGSVAACSERRLLSPKSLIFQ
ncbi:unnamed protein product [Sphagnum troendelagicum]|uniref:Uncharacterized protein n=1 Tax=Sphagnum troendelagicum TaxID=128251 RepID=A0ABP0TBC2_9BRYO